jgi:23S rRNA (cytosine1962-C5)-methyltransferase
MRGGINYQVDAFAELSYGHGPKGEVWRIDDHLPPLLSLLAELTDGNPQLLLVTCHSPGYTP